MGRADQTAKVRGMFVHPSQVAEVLRRHPEVARARLVVEGEMANDRMTLQVEVAPRADGLAERIADSVRDVTKLRGEVALLRAGQPAQRRQGDRGRAPRSAEPHSRRMRAT